MIEPSLAAPDIRLSLDRDGVIRDAALAGAFAEETATAWIGLPWAATVPERDGLLLGRILGEVQARGLSPFRPLVQRLPSGREVAVEYTTFRQEGGQDLVAVGKSLQAVTEIQNRLIETQQAMAQDYLKLREIETRYRHLVNASSEAVLLLDARDFGVLEANPMAARTFGLGSGPPKANPARRLLDCLRPEDLDTFLGMLHEVRERGGAPGTLVRIGAARDPWFARASLMVAQDHPVFLVQFAPAEGPLPAHPTWRESPLEHLVERSPDAFTVIDHQGAILRANRAFLDLVQMGSETAILGKPLGRWLGRPGADLTVLLANVRRLGAVRLFSTKLYGELGSEIEVEISAVGNAPTNPTHIGVCTRNIDRRLSTENRATSSGQWLDILAKQVGRTSLRRLVDEATEVIERHYIDAALDLAAGNRTVAAELLGISRQSLYVKFGRYGLDGEERAGVQP